MSRLRKGLIGVAAVIAATIVLLCIALAWLVYTPSGLRFALNRASAAMHGRFHYAQVQGTLHGPLTVTGLVYRDADGDRLRVRRATLDLQPFDLLRGRLHVQHASIEGVEVTLGGPTTTNNAWSLQPPMPILLDDARITGIAITRNGQSVFLADSLLVSGSWSDIGLKIGRLSLRSPSGHADLNMTLALAPGYRGDGHARFAWLWRGVRYAGTLDARSNGKLAHFKLTLSAPMRVQLDATVHQDADLAWTMTLDAPRFAAAPLLGESSSFRILALSLHGAGDRRGGRIEGALQINDHQLLLDPAQFSIAGQTLRLNPLVLRSPDVSGALAAVGKLQLDAKPLAASLDVAWTGVRLPADLVGQSLLTHGQAHFSSNSGHYAVQGDFAIGPPGRLLQLRADLAGTPDRITLHSLKMMQAKGGLDARGTLTLAPQLGWDLEATAKRFDPGTLFAGWNGALDFKIASRGVQTANGPRATLKLSKLAGTLRKRRIAGNADLRIAPGYIIGGTLKLASGNSTISVVGRGGARTDATLKLATASLGDWLPNASGRLDGHFDVAGRWPRLSIAGQLQGNALRRGPLRADALRLAASIPDISRPGGDLDLTLHGAAVAGYALDSVSVTGHGNANAHQIRLAFHGEQLSGSLALIGHWRERDKSWSGSLSGLEIAVSGLPGWHQEQPAAMTWRGGAATLSQLCIDAGQPRLCVDAQRDRRSDLTVQYEMQRLPALWLTLFAGSNLPLRADGELSGAGTLTRSADGTLGGNANLRSNTGSIAYADEPDRPLLAWRNLALDARIANGAQHIALSAAFANGGSVRGDATVSGPAQTLSGDISIDLRDLGFLALLNPEVAAVHGKASGTITLAGTLDAPRFRGRVAATGFATELPRVGLKLHDGRFELSADDTRQLRIEGHVMSGSGTLSISGSMGLSAAAPLSLHLRGSDALALDIPAARVTASPDLQLQRGQDRYTLTGKVVIPRAQVDLGKLPGPGATQASPDVVIVDEPVSETSAQSMLSIYTDVEVILGDNVHVVGDGLDGKIRGTVTVRDRPLQPTTARGALHMDGTYRAYGQNLTVKSGRLLFAGTPIDNPGLDLRAAREIRSDNVTVGLRVQGTAQKPLVTVYSDPPMEQAQALSYLVTSRPFSSRNGGQSDALALATQALGTAAGDRIAKRLGTQLGVDEIGVSSSSALGGSAFTVGKYLSPRLYLSYGVGVFTPGEVITLRYRFNRYLEFEAENATTGNRAGLNYKIEK